MARQESTQLGTKAVAGVVGPPDSQRAKGFFSPGGFKRHGRGDMERGVNYGDEILVGVEDAKEEKFELGEWSRWAHCFNGSAVCGIEIRYEEPYVGDDAAVTDLVMYCCDMGALDEEETEA
ncbi:uncharacterized protein LOC119577496 [Penaeus monodon]|uniref:uncharacterized protein LOC119577496 n=1 Tax=Penaeus monodon TaxID=6687 RepID=UPI0018A7B132|nr:uncharacterized protein LOC119577496 [Penaeus monodon]